MVRNTGKALKTLIIGVVVLMVFVGVFIAANTNRLTVGQKMALARESETTAALQRGDLVAAEAAMVKHGASDYDLFLTDIRSARTMEEVAVYLSELPKSEFDQFAESGTRPTMNRYNNVDLNKCFLDEVSKHQANAVTLRQRGATYAKLRQQKADREEQKFNESIRTLREMRASQAGSQAGSQADPKSSSQASGDAGRGVNGGVQGSRVDLNNLSTAEESLYRQAKKSGMTNDAIRSLIQNNRQMGAQLDKADREDRSR